MTSTEAQEEDSDVSSRFEHIMESTLLPSSGPAHFAARRALWRRPISFPPPRTEQSAKLLELLDREGPIDSDELWNKGLDKIWKGVTGGGRLKRRLPMRYLVRRPSLTNTSARLNTIFSRLKSSKQDGFETALGLEGTPHLNPTMN